MSEAKSQKALLQEAEDLVKQIAQQRQAQQMKDLSVQDHNLPLQQYQDSDNSMPPLQTKELKKQKDLKGHFGKVYAMHWGNSSHSQSVALNEMLVSASQDGKLIVWNAITQNKLHAIPLRSSWVMTCAFEPTQGELVACGGLDNLCSIYRVAHTDASPYVAQRAHKELAAHDGYLSCCRFFDKGSKIVTSSGDSSCIMWDIQRAESLSHFNDHNGDVMSVSINPKDEKMFVSGSCDSTARIWDIRGSASPCIDTFYGHESDINSVQFNSDGRTFATGSDDSTCRMFDIRCGEIGQYGNDRILCGITSVALSSSGRLLFAGYDDYRCLGWDTMYLGPSSDDVTGSSPLYQVEGHDNRVSCLGINATGEALCTGSWDTYLKIWA